MENMEKSWHLKINIFQAWKSLKKLWSHKFWKSREKNSYIHTLISPVLYKCLLF